MKIPSTALAMIIAAAGLAMSAIAVGQPEDGPPPRDGPPPPAHEFGGPGDAEVGAPPPDQAGRQNDQRPMDAAAFRQRLLNRIEEARRLIERAENAIDSLEKGVPVQRVMNEFNADGRDGPLLPQERERICAFVKEHMPRLWERLEPLEKGAPQRADRMLLNMRPKIRELVDLQRRNPKVFELKLEETRALLMAMEASRELRGLRARGATPQEIAAAEARVEELVGQNVDAQLKLKANEVEMLGRRLDTLRKEIDAQTADREKIIEQRTRRMTAAGPDRAGRDGPPDQPPGDQPPPDQPRRRQPR